MPQHAPHVCRQATDAGVDERDVQDLIHHYAEECDARLYSVRIAGRRHWKKHLSSAFGVNRVANHSPINEIT